MIRAAIGAGFIAAASVLIPSAPAHAAPDPDLGSSCDTVPWGFLGHQRRTVCDGAIRPDGSWGRKRSIWTPAHQVPTHTSCYGTYSVSCDTWGGGYVEMSIDDTQIYTVTPETVLPDEPGHLQ
jgi:hypothetical protein